MSTDKGLAEAPIGGGDIVRDGGAAVGCDDPERESLGDKNGAYLPIYAPIALHLHPPGPRALYVYGHHIPGTPHIEHEHQVEVWVPIHHEPHPPLLRARNPGELQHFILLHHLINVHDSPPA